MRDAQEGKTVFYRSHSCCALQIAYSRHCKQVTRSIPLCVFRFLYRCIVRPIKL